MNARTWNMRVKGYMRQYHMAEPGAGILAAVSGGADSVCLLLVLKALANTLGIRVAAFHLNHGLRGAEADRDEAYVVELCEQLDVPLKVVHEDVAGYAKERRLSEEEAGRVLRYQHLEAAARAFSCQKIATAHHKDDNVETILMNLFRGSGLRGLGGIRPVREISERLDPETDVDSKLEIIRPLLCMTRQEIEAYLIEETVSWCEDSTNHELNYVRNKVRNVLIPWVRAHINEQTDEHILKTAMFAAQADEYFSAEAEKLLGELDLAEIAATTFDAQPDIMKSYLVRAMIARASGSAKDISVRHIEAVCALTGPGGGTTADLPYGLQAVRSYETLSICRKGNFEPEIPAKQGSCLLDTAKTIENSRVVFGSGEEITLQSSVFKWKKEQEIPKKQYTKWFDYDKIKGTLYVRTRENGDYITIGNGKTKKLNRFFIDEKIPEELRDRIPLLAEGNHILWIIGYRISEYYKLSDMTRNVLEVRADKGEKHD